MGELTIWNRVKNWCARLFVEALPWSIIRLCLCRAGKAVGGDYCIQGLTMQDAYDAIERKIEG